MKKEQLLLLIAEDNYIKCLLYKADIAKNKGGIKLKEKLKKNRGITLIALIITIIVMIILVAVTVNIANENGGLFVRTRQAKVDTAYRAEQENLLMYMYGEDYDAATGKLNLAGLQAKLVNDNNTSNRWESITLNAALTELTVVGTQSGKTHTILSNGTLDGENDSLQGIIISSTKNGSLDLDDLEKKLNDSDKWTDAKKDGDKVTVTDKETGKEYEISKDGTITEKNNQSSNTNLYEGKLWGKGLTADKLKELGFTDEEITAATTKKVYFRGVHTKYYEQVSKANNLEEANQILDEIGSTLPESEKDEVGTWTDVTEERVIDEEVTASAATIGIKNSKLMLSYNAESIFYIDVVKEVENRITLTATDENEDNDGNKTTTTYDNWPAFVKDNGNSIYFIMFGS